MLSVVKRIINKRHAARLKVARAKLAKIELSIRDLEEKQFSLRKKIEWMKENEPSLFEKLWGGAKLVAGIGVAAAGFLISRDLTPFHMVNHAVLDKSLEIGRHLEKGGVKLTGSYSSDLAALEEALRKTNAAAEKENSKFWKVANFVSAISRKSEKELDKESLQLSAALLFFIASISLAIYLV